MLCYDGDFQRASVTPIDAGVDQTAVALILNTAQVSTREFHHLCRRQLALISTTNADNAA